MQKGTSKEMTAKFIFKNKLHTGIISDFSEGGMLLCTEEYIPFNVKLKILIIFNKKRMVVPVKVSGLMKAENLPFPLLVKVLDASKDYLEFLDNIKTVPAKFKPHSQSIT